MFDIEKGPLRLIKISLATTISSFDCFIHLFFNTEIGTINVSSWASKRI